MYCGYVVGMKRRDIKKLKGNEREVIPTPPGIPWEYGAWDKFRERDGGQENMKGEEEIRSKCKHTEQKRWQKTQKITLFFPFLFCLGGHFFLESMDCGWLLSNQNLGRICVIQRERRERENTIRDESGPPRCCNQPQTWTRWRTKENPHFTGTKKTVINVNKNPRSSRTDNNRAFVSWLCDAQVARYLHLTEI